MESTMTLSHLADLIVVISFFSICGGSIGYVLAEALSLIVGGIRKKLKLRKERKAKELEEASKEETE